MSTRALVFLKQKRIPHEVVKYDHEAKGARFAAQAVGFPLAQTIKTLVVALDNRSYTLALMPGDRQLSLKKIAAACKVRKAAMADSQTAERLTGYLIGGISPFATQKHLPAIMESSVQSYPAVIINGGRRGLMVKMAPEDIVKAIDARIASIAELP
jgi:Cys-tRNA(Pro)/Cys-tRNA(Cys) deacylase